jgi:hypothetical protein
MVCEEGPQAGVIHQQGSWPVQIFGVLAGASDLAQSAADHLAVCPSLEPPIGAAGRYMVAAGQNDRDLIGA